MARRKPSKLNCLVAVDKPTGITSHDMVARVRRAVGERRVGHAGTLDPAASGVMVMGIGQATRLLGLLTLDEKSYVARIAFGAETNTDDAEGEVVRTAPVDEALADPQRAAEELKRFEGPSLQVPPAFSAISVNGRRAYKAARAGEEVELAPRQVNVLNAQLIAVTGGPGTGEALAWEVAFTVSKGTYVRALARDIGRAVGSAAHVAALRRTASGSITLARCVSEESLPRLSEERDALDPLEALGCPCAVLPEDAREDVLCGRAVPRRRVLSATFDTGAPLGADKRVGVVIAGRLQALAAYDGRALRMKDVFPGGVGGIR